MKYYSSGRKPEEELPREESRVRGVRNNNVILHTCQVCWLGSVPLFIRDFARAFPEFHHVMNFMHDWKVSYKVQDILRNDGVEVCHTPKVTKRFLHEVDPLCFIMHNTPGKLIEGKYPYSWLSEWPLVVMHHVGSKPVIPAQMDVFVSEEVFGRGFQKTEFANKVFCPPCIDASPYVAVERSENNERCVIGKLNTESPRRHPKDMLELYRKTQAAHSSKCLAFTIVGGAEHYTDKDGKTWDKARAADRREIEATFHIGVGGAAGSHCASRSKHHIPFAGLHHVWMPPVGHRLPESFYRSFDIFVLRNPKVVTDTWSRVVTEAMASGLPVIAENRGGPAEQIENEVDGFLFDNDDQFLLYLHALIESPAFRYSVGMKAREKAASNFALPRLRDTFRTFFLKCLAGVY